MKDSIDLSLGRIQALLRLLHAPHHNFPVIHVAGTNGKGSVCAMLAAMLMRGEGNLVVGQFNSPHLLEPRDCVRINTRVVSEDIWRTSMELCRVAQEQVEVTEFESLTATAFLALSLSNVDVAVIEVGVGGREDASNCFPPFPHTLASVLTSIDFDHMNLLGNTIESISSHKAGILKLSTPVIVGPQIDEYFDSIKQVVVNESCVVHSLDPIFVDSLSVRRIHSYKCLFRPSNPLKFSHQLCNASETSKTPQEMTFTLPLNGDFQLRNAATAIHTLLALQQLSPQNTAPLVDVIKSTPIECYLKALESIEWPGRLEWIQLPKLAHQRVLIDGAHNRGAARELRNFVDSLELTRNVFWIFGMTEGKSMDVFSLLFRPNDTVAFVGFSQPQGMPWVSCYSPLKLQQWLKESLAVDSLCFDSVSDCFSHLISNAASMQPTLTVCCGSLYLVSDVHRFLLDQA